jgi:hypothetical protein
VRIPVETLIDGVVRTLVEAVLPDVRTRFARGQLYAAIDVLRNLRDRVEVRAALLAEEAASAEGALAAAAEALRAAGADAAADCIAAARRGAPPEPPAARVAGLRAAVITAIETIDALDAAVAAAARAPIDRHLAAQAMRDVAVLKPSMLAEISRG